MALRLLSGGEEANTALPYSSLEGLVPLPMPVTAMAAKPNSTQDRSMERTTGMGKYCPPLLRPLAAGKVHVGCDMRMVVAA